MIEFPTDRGSAVIAVAGEIDIASVGMISAQVAAALDAAPSQLELLMRDVTFIDSTGIGAIVTARNACKAAGVSLIITDPSQRVLRVLQLTGLHRVLSFRTTDGQAAAL